VIDYSLVMDSVKPELQLVCDFVNTLDRESGRDELADAMGLGVWLRARGLWSGRPDEDDAAARRAEIGVRFDTGSIRLVAPSRGVGEVLVAAGAAMADGSWSRLKACRSSTCRWAFVDTARNRSRQWCSMSVCGNREKARSFRRRHGAASA
jgi:hypothetical protein